VHDRDRDRGDGGKEELGAAAIRRAGAAYAAHVGERWGPADDIVAATEAAFAGAADTMRESDFADACPIATIALEISSSSDTMRVACDEVFRSWITGMTAVFVRGGVPADRAEPLATQWLALLEGAFIFCRAARNTDALEEAGRAAAALVRAALQ
jgi:hypothetical protein